MKKQPYYRVKYAELKSISEKAWIVRCYDGSQDMLPKSQCLQSLDSLLVPVWLAQKKTIQYAQKKIWLSSAAAVTEEKSHICENPGCEDEKDDPADEYCEECTHAMWDGLSARAAE